MITKAYSSSLPAIISAESRYFTGAENKLKFIAGPTRLKPGPMLPIQVTTLVKDVKKSKPSKHTARVETKVISMCKNSRFVTEETVSILIIFSLTLRLTIAFGCNRIFIVRLISFSIISIRITLMPPLVEEEQPPTNISMKISILLKVGHTS